MYTPWLIPEGHEYQYDLGWLVRKLLSFETELNTAIDLKTIHYADPLQWDITTQYSPNTVVVDPKTGTAYMSKIPVPAGVQLTNTDYWVVVFNYQRIYDKIMSGVAFNDQDNLEASKDIQKYDFVWFGGDLYQAQRDIPQGSKYIPDVNIVSATIADALAAYYGDTRTASITNDTVTVAETQKIAAKNRVISVTGDQTVNAGDIAETSANRTIKTTADYHVDVDGNMSDHVDGVTTKNYGGAVTAAYGSSLDVGVTGTYSADYRGDATETYAGKRNVSVQRMQLTSSAKTLPIVFPDKTLDLHNVTPDFIYNKTDNDDSSVDINSLLAKGNVMLVPGEYTIKSPITIPSGNQLIGNGANISVSTSFTDDYAIIIGGDPDSGALSTNTQTLVENISITCNFVCNGIYIRGKRCNVQNVKINDVSEIGIDVFKYGNNKHTPSDAYIAYTEINQHPITKYHKIGIRLNGTDNNIIACRTLGSQIGIQSTADGGGLYCTDCHPLAFESNTTGWSDSIGFDLQDTGTVLTNCYADNFKIGINIVSQKGPLTINGFTYYCWEYKNVEMRTGIQLGGTVPIAGSGVLIAPSPYVRRMLWKDYYWPTIGQFSTLSFISSNEPDNFHYDDTGLQTEIMTNKNYIKNVATDKSFALIVSPDATKENFMQNTFDILSEEFILSGLTLKAIPGNTPTITSWGVCSATDVTVTVKQSEDKTQTYLLIEKNSGYMGNVNVFPRGIGAVALPRTFTAPSNLKQTHIHTYTSPL